MDLCRACLEEDKPTELILQKSLVPQQDKTRLK